MRTDSEVSMKTAKTNLSERATGTDRRIGARLLALTIGLAFWSLSACGNLLEVSNPNNVVQSDVELPGAAAALANGSLAELSTAAARNILIYSMVSDELQYIGSLTYVQQLEEGIVRVLDNDWVDQGFSRLAVSRWLADEAIRVLSGFDQDGILSNRNLLGRAYLYSGVSYAMVGDVWEDFAFSDRRDASRPVGEANMHTVYDLAIERLDNAVNIFRQTGNTDLELTALAMRARAKWAQALWHKLRPTGGVPSDPLLNVASANADAQSVVDRAPIGWRPSMGFNSASGANPVGQEVTRQVNAGLSGQYFRMDGTGRVACGPWSSGCPNAEIMVIDPLDGVENPALRSFLFEFMAGDQFAALPLVSTKEMRLILAEAHLAQGDLDGFASHLNAVRQAHPELTAYDPTVHAGIDPVDLLEYERKANLYLYVGRRLADMYRFDVKSATWISTGEAASHPGSFFRVPQSERISNCFYLGTC